jgi:hypothetical protein
LKHLINVDNYDDFALWLGRFKPGERIEIIVRRERSVSSPAQNRYYWGVIVKLIADYTGHEPDEIHSIMKWKFLKQKDERNIEYVPSVSNLSTEQREEYHEKCRRWATVVLDLNIPLPNQVDVPVNS